MANFRQHLNFGICTSLVSATVSCYSFGLSYIQGAAAFIIGVIASLAPDIDLPESTPGQLLFNNLGILLPLGIFFYIPAEYTKDFKLEHCLVGMVCGYLIVKYGIAFCFDKLTVHRGIFHSIPAVIICGELIFLLFAHLPLQSRIVMGCVGIIGYLTHLVADELYSVDWSGKKIKLKQSLGTALDIGSLTKLSTWCAYLIVGVLGYFIWQQIQQQ